MYRILKTLHEAGGSSRPTQLQLGSHTNYTQLERYLEFMETLGLITVRDDPATGSRIVALAPKRKTLFGFNEAPEHASTLRSTHEPLQRAGEGDELAILVEIMSVLEALLPNLVEHTETRPSPLPRQAAPLKEGQERKGAC
jgi:DNA-binding MarR family transcriptional regulator